MKTKVATRRLQLGLAIVSTLLLSACAERANLDIKEGTGPKPVLPSPPSSMGLPTVNAAKAVGWAAGGLPIPAEGLAVNAFATAL